MQSHNRFSLLASALATMLLAGCERPPPDESTQSLLADPARLKKVARLCREDRKQVSEQTCLNAALAQRERFKGRGATRYTPEDTEILKPPAAEPR